MPIEEPPRAEEQLSELKLRSKWGFVNTYSAENVRIQKLIDLKNRIKYLNDYAQIKRSPKDVQSDSLLNKARKSLIARTEKEKIWVRKRNAEAAEKKAAELKQKYNELLAEHKQINRNIQDKINQKAKDKAKAKEQEANYSKTLLGASNVLPVNYTTGGYRIRKLTKKHNRKIKYTKLKRC
jgi:hypothetical protein